MPNIKITTAKSTALIIATLLILAAVALITPVRHQARTIITTITARASAPAIQPFPQIKEGELSELQQSIIELAQAEYVSRPVSYDSHVQKYTEDNNEAWCADFVSWLMKEAGTPFNNPHSDSWRIPGVHTLQEYFESTDRFMPAGSYTPQTGDVAFLHGPGGHVALVLAADNGRMITIGGNEKGRMRISDRSIQPGAEGLIGFGALPR